MGGRNTTWPSRGAGEKRVNYIKFEMAAKLQNSYHLPKLFLVLPFERCYVILSWPWFIICMVTSFTDDIFRVILKFSNLKIKIWLKLKNILTTRGWYGLPISTTGALGGARVPPSAKWSGGQDCRGKIEGLKLSFFFFIFFYYELDPLRIFGITKSRKRRTYSTHSLDYGHLWRAVITFAGSAKYKYIQGDKKWPL